LIGAALWASQSRWVGSARNERAAHLPRACAEAARVDSPMMHS